MFTRKEKVRKERRVEKQMPCRESLYSETYKFTE
jgi:hypothetical protein